MVIKKIKKKIEYYLISLNIKIKLIKYNFNIKWLGNNYGGFYVELNSLNKNSVVYNFGIGTDISFDTDLIKEKDVTIFAFDPTPKSIKWIKNNKIDNFEFFEYGIGTKDEITKFFLPQNKDYVSGSIVYNNHLSKEYVNVKLKTLKTIMKELNHNYLDLLKLDIEGSEYEILNYIIDNDIKINQIVVEFHNRFFKKVKIWKKILLKN
jgi:FkbM family methyltransferase